MEKVIDFELEHIRALKHPIERSAPGQKIHSDRQTDRQIDREREGERGREILNWNLILLRFSVGEHDKPILFQV